MNVALDENRSGQRQRPKVVSLFSGAGGFDLGFHWAWFNTRVMVEIGEPECETLRMNFTKDGFLAAVAGRREYFRQQFEEGRMSESEFARALEKCDKEETEFNGVVGSPGYVEPVIIQKDIRKVASEEILAAADAGVGDVDAVIGWPPCQGFSQANNARFIDDPRNFLYKEFVRVVSDVRPKFFVMENVKWLVTIAKRGGVIRQIAADFARCGYMVSWEVANCADYGVPQNRVRLVILGKRVGIPSIGTNELFGDICEALVSHDRKYADRWAKEALSESRAAIVRSVPGFEAPAERPEGALCDVVAVGTDKMEYFDGSEGEHSTAIICDRNGSIAVQCYCDGDMVEHDPGIVCAVDAAVRYLVGEGGPETLVSDGGFSPTFDGSFVVPFAHPLGRARNRPHVIVWRSWDVFRAEVRDYPEGFNSVPKSMLAILEAAASKTLAVPA